MFKSILVPIDPGQAEKGAALIGKARQLLDKDGTITLFTAVEEPPAYIAVELPSDLMKNSLANAERLLGDLHEASGLGKAAKTIVRPGRAATTILEVAEDIGADLIMVASHRPGMQDYLIGSTAARTVRHAKCSVLVVR